MPKERIFLGMYLLVSYGGHHFVRQKGAPYFIVFSQLVRQNRRISAVQGEIIFLAILMSRMHRISQVRIDFRGFSFSESRRFAIIQAPKSFKFSQQKRGTKICIKSCVISPKTFFRFSKIRTIARFAIMVVPDGPLRVQYF